MQGLFRMLSEEKARTTKYPALNRLALRGIWFWLMLELSGDDPPELVLFESVLRIATRGRSSRPDRGTLPVVRIRGCANNSRL